ncbi:MAG: D-alanyl-D-alanine carboxypeptidase/D-alanyl-D-alanine-endopeptidase [Ignavibacteria bacterium]|nr:D-alanyl-D-alanine carboxypeptidase/D-alanyl-D-alanine-endopeptidase [Ignavibacteria bacterium]
MKNSFGICTVSIIFYAYFFSITPQLLAQSHTKNDQTDSVRIKTLNVLLPKTSSDTTKQERRQVRFSPVRELQTDIDGLVLTPELSNANIGISIVSIESGENFYRKNETKNFIPASTLKTLTTAAALDYLGRDFRYSTKFYFDGEPPKDGEFIGNLIIRASGDPTMSTYFYTDPIDVLEIIALKLDSLGIRSIRGNIIADDSYFDDNYYASGWALDDVMYPFSAQVDALSFGDNKVDVRVVPAQVVGELSRITMQPDNSYIRIINNTLTVPSDVPEILTPSREPRTNSIEIRGKIPIDAKGMNSNSGTRLSVTIDNPALYFLNLFKQTLEKHGIKVRGALLDYEDWNMNISYTQLQLIAEHTSPPLSEIIAVVNKYSHNLCAEMLIKTIGKETTGIGSFAKGIEQVKKYASRIGILQDNISVVDGSGLSRLNLLSPQNQVALLSSIYRSDKRNDFIESLAIPGAQGTLRVV